MSIHRPVSFAAFQSSATRLLIPVAIAAMLSLGGVALSDHARAADLSDLHICNADEITTIPELESDSANDCINDQNDNGLPKALMCSPGGKAFCCTQNVDQLGKCMPIVGGRKRTVPLHDATVPKGEPGANDLAPVEPAPIPDNLPQ
jgi:hypothetical protein